MYREYNAQLLRQVQMTEKKILEKFMSICEKYELKYFLVFGTLLGAVRHKGFIPWDDDIDVGMLRNDYEKFLEVAQGECGNEFFIQTADTDPHHHLYFAKMRMNDTEFVEESLQTSGSVTGFYIDIFPYDTVPDDNKEMRKYLKHAINGAMLLSVNKTKEPQIAKGSMIITFVKRWIWYGLHYGMKILGISGERVWTRCSRIMKKYEDSEGLRVTTFLVDAYESIIYREELEDVVDLEFEDIVVKAPKGYSKILERYYGDYMTLPPKEQRENHVPIRIRFAGEKEALTFEEN